MPFFALQVRTGAESQVLALAKEHAAIAAVELYWPRRNLRIKRGGVWRDSLAPIFPGYLFVYADGISSDLYRKLRGLPSFIRFLLSNDNIVPLRGEGQRLLSYFLSFGEVVEKSIAYFDENRRIRIVSGPLKGLDGKIIKVDRRKGRARVRLELYQDSFEIDFGFDFLEAVPPSAHAALV